MPAPKKYDLETQERAVRMYADRIAEGDVSQKAARQEVGELLGINPETLRNWIRRDLGEGATRPAAGAAGESLEAEVARLRRENARLQRANEILKTASAFFASAELDRRLGS
jgi:transposase-like protein